MSDDDAKAFALINDCVGKLTKLAGAPVPVKWQAYFSDGIGRHALAIGLKQFRPPLKRPTLIDRTKLPKSETSFVESM